jgi:hypothetical protein
LFPEKPGLLNSLKVVWRALGRLRKEKKELEASLSYRGGLRAAWSRHCDVEMWLGEKKPS